jgi:hypothetical protein
MQTLILCAMVGGPVILAVAAAFVAIINWARDARKIRRHREAVRRAQLWRGQ